MSSTAVALWVGLMVAAMAIYMVAYTLLRTSGDGRPWHVRLRHPMAGGRADAQPQPDAGTKAAEDRVAARAPEPGQSEARERTSHAR